MARSKNLSPRRGAARAGGIAIVLALAAGGAYLYLAAGDVSAPVEPDPGAGEGRDADSPRGPMTEAERVAYVKRHVKVEGLRIGPDLQPDGETPVPGLLSVQGEVVNGGERAVSKVILTVLPKDAKGEVLSAHVEDVAKKGPALGPGDRREFRFTIPDKKSFEGDFGYELR